MLSDVTQTAKYGTATKESACKYFYSSKYFYTRQMLNFKVVSRTPTTSKLELFVVTESH